MFVTDDLDLVGRLTVRKYSCDGRLVEEVSAHNHITVDGRKLVARLFNKEETGVKTVSKIQVGSSEKKFEPGQTALLDKVGETAIKKVEMEPVSDSEGKPRVRLRIVGELGETECNGALCEAGLFTDDDDNVMYNRVTFGTITKSDQFRLTLIWEILF